MPLHIEHIPNYCPLLGQFFHCATPAAFPLQRQWTMANFCGLSNIISPWNNSTKPGKEEVPHQDARVKLGKQNVCLQIRATPRWSL